jgi:hypothetical protein
VHYQVKDFKGVFLESIDEPTTAGVAESLDNDIVSASEDFRDPTHLLVKVEPRIALHLGPGQENLQPRILGVKRRPVVGVIQMDHWSADIEAQELLRSPVV